MTRQGRLWCCYPIAASLWVCCKDACHGGQSAVCLSSRPAWSRKAVSCIIISIAQESIDLKDSSIKGCISSCGRLANWLPYLSHPPIATPLCHTQRYDQAFLFIRTHNGIENVNCPGGEMNDRDGLSYLITSTKVFGGGEKEKTSSGIGSSKITSSTAAIAYSCPSYLAL